MYMNCLIKDILTEVTNYYTEFSNINESRVRCEEYAPYIMSALQEYEDKYFTQERHDFTIKDKTLAVCNYDEFPNILNLPERIADKVLGVYEAPEDVLYIRFSGDYDMMFNICLHELEHSMDKETVFLTKNHAFTNLGVKLKFNDDKYINAIGDIIYKLWNYTERNAWAINAMNYDDGGLDGYCKMLEEQINLAEECPGTNINVWGKVRRLYNKPRKARQGTYEDVKVHFIKQSRLRLKSFYKSAKKKKWHSIMNNTGVYIGKGGNLGKKLNVKRNKKAAQ